MEILKSDNFITIGVDLEKSMLYAKWLPMSKDISEEYFKDTNWLYVQLCENHTLSSFLLDTTDFDFTISPTTQTWVAENILPKLSTFGMKKVAFLVSTDFITQMSIEQTMEEKVFNFSVRYFDQSSEALNWLLGK